MCVFVWGAMVCVCADGLVCVCVVRSCVLHLLSAAKAQKVEMDKLEKAKKERTKVRTTGEVSVGFVFLYLD